MSNKVGVSPPLVVQVRPLGSGNTAPGNNIQSNTKPVNGMSRADGLGVVPPQASFNGFNGGKVVNQTGFLSGGITGDASSDTAFIEAARIAAEKEELQTRAKEEKEEAGDEGRQVLAPLNVSPSSPFHRSNNQLAAQPISQV